MTPTATSEIQTAALVVECEALGQNFQAMHPSVVEVGPRVRLHMKLREDLEVDRRELPAGFLRLAMESAGEAEILLQVSHEILISSPFWQGEEQFNRLEIRSRPMPLFLRSTDEELSEIHPVFYVFNAAHRWDLGIFLPEAMALSVSYRAVSSRESCAFLGGGNKESILLTWFRFPRCMDNPSPRASRFSCYKWRSATWQRIANHTELPAHCGHPRRRTHPCHPG